MRATSISTYTRIWHVSEKELQEEIAFLKQDPAYQLPLHIPYDQYENLLRKIAYWHISRVNIISLGIINLLLIGGSVMVYNARNNFAWMNAVLLKVLLAIIVIHAGIYFLAGIPLNKYKTKLSVK